MLWLQRLRSARPSSGEVRGHPRGPEGECELPGARAEVIIIIIRVQWRGHGGQVEEVHLPGEKGGDKAGRDYPQDEWGLLYFQQALSESF